MTEDKVKSIQVIPVTNMVARFEKTDNEENVIGESVEKVHFLIFSQRIDQDGDSYITIEPIVKADLDMGEVESKKRSHGYLGLKEVL